jgi:hypothetical protein
MPSMKSIRGRFADRRRSTSKTSGWRQSINVDAVKRRLRRGR